jgi:DNA (cytosine-5)-methyltransferase 1
MNHAAPITVNREAELQRPIGVAFHRIVSHHGLTHLDLFSGIGGFALAAASAGFQTIGFSEIEPYSCAVLKKHWPEIKNYGDIRHLTGKTIYGILDSCNGNAQNVKSETSQATGHTASHATPSALPSGERQTGSITGKRRMNGVKKNGVKSSPTTEESAPAAENPILNFSPLTTSSTMETPSEKSIKVQRGKSPCGADSQTIIKSCVTTATKQNPILEYAHTRKRIDLVTGGFPCQPYSLAGQRRGSEDDRALWPQVVRLLQEMDAVGGLPTWCLFENVAGIINMELDRVLDDLEHLGYAAWPIVIPACAVDARHRRMRVWIMGNADGLRPCGTENGQSHHAGNNGDAERSDELCEPARPGGARKENVADADRERKSQSEGCLAEIGRRSGNGGKALADATIGQDDGRKRGDVAIAEGCGQRLNAAADIGGEDGQPRSWKPESGFRRVANGIPNRTHRLRGLGNAIVPQVASEILKNLVMANGA